MLPAPFEYHRPGSLYEALQLLSSLGEAKVLAGGQSLIPLLKFRFAAPAHLVDVNWVPGLDGIAEDGGALRIGALVRHNQVAASDLVSTRFPVLAAAAPQIADPIVRNLGTVCGSLAHADPAGDWGAVMLATGATVVARSVRGERHIPIGDFFQDIFTTALEPDELVTEVRVPAPAGRTGGTYLKLERKVGDFATAAVAAQVTLAPGGTCERAGIGLTNVGPTPIQAKRAEAYLVGKRLEDGVIKEAARLAAEESQPVSDLRGPAEYKRDLVRVLAARALRKALARAGGGR